MEAARQPKRPTPRPASASAAGTTPFRDRRRFRGSSSLQHELAIKAAAKSAGMSQAREQRLLTVWGYLVDIQSRYWHRAEWTMKDIRKATLRYALGGGSFGVRTLYKLLHRLVEAGVVEWEYNCIRLTGALASPPPARRDPDTGFPLFHARRRQRNRVYAKNRRSRLRAERRAAERGPQEASDGATLAAAERRGADSAAQNAPEQASAVKIRRPSPAQPTDIATLCPASGVRGFAAERQQSLAEGGPSDARAPQPPPRPAEAPAARDEAPAAPPGPRPTVPQRADQPRPPGPTPRPLHPPTGGGKAFSLQASTTTSLSQPEEAGADFEGKNVVQKPAPSAREQLFRRYPMRPDKPKRPALRPLRGLPGGANDDEQPDKPPLIDQVDFAGLARTLRAAPPQPREASIPRRCWTRSVAPQAQVTEADVAQVRASVPLLRDLRTSALRRMNVSTRELQRAAQALAQGPPGRILTDPARYLSGIIYRLRGSAGPAP